MYDGAPGVTGARRFRADARGLRAAQVKPVPCLLLQEVVTPLRPPPVLFSQWLQPRNPPPPLLAAWPRRAHRLKLLSVVVCTPLVPLSLPLLPMSLCYHLGRGWSAVSDVGSRDAHVMASCGCVAYSCCASHSCSAARASACSLARARRAAPWL